MGSWYYVGWVDLRVGASRGGGVTVVVLGAIVGLGKANKKGSGSVCIGSETGRDRLDCRVAIFAGAGVLGFFFFFLAEAF